MWELLIYLMRKILKPAWLEKYTGIYRQSGWKGIFKTGGIKLIIAFFLFKEVPDLWTWVGSLVIFSSGIYIANRESAALKERRKTGTPATDTSDQNL